MYETYYGLQEKPFSIMPDPKFLYFSRSHRMAFSMLEYGIVNQAGFTVITGAIGSGKTTLVNHLLSRIQEDARIGLISHTPRNGGNLLEWILMAFGQPFEDAAYPRLYKRFCDFVSTAENSPRRTVLIIDEAQNLQTDRLEELRMLSNINRDEMLMQLILIGQPELRDMLQSAGMTQFAQRVSSDFHLPELEETDACKYINHRLKVAGGRPDLFSMPAKVMIYEEARGVPRIMNVLADRCLVYAYAKSARSVSSSTVRKVLKDRQRHGIYSAQPRLTTPAAFREVMEV